jgi:hypothetical protein
MPARQGERGVASMKRREFTALICGAMPALLALANEVID